MSFLQQISVLILTYNEAPNIGRTLSALKDFGEVVLLDSGSSDDTLAIAARHKNVRVVTRTFDSHAAQWNFGLGACGLKGEWVLALDADYLLGPQSVAEIDALFPARGVNGFRAQFDYAVQGKLLSRSLYPPVTVLYRKSQAHCVQDGHTHRVVVQGSIGALRHRLIHDDRKPLARWLASQQAYAQLEAEQLLTRGWRQLSMPDRLRRCIVITPWLVPLYCMTLGLGFKDGWPGLYYALQRGLAESVLSLKLIELRSGSRARLDTGS